MQISKSIGNRLGIGFGLLTVIAAALAIASLVSIRRTGVEFDNAAHFDARKLDLAHSIANGAAGMLSGQRGLVLRALIHDFPAAAAYQSDFAETSAKVDAMLRETKPLIETQQGRRDIAGIEENLATWRAAVDEMNRVYRRDPKLAEKKYEASIPPAKQIQTLTADFCALQRAQIESRAAAAHTRIVRMEWLVTILGAACAIIGCALLWFLRTSTKALSTIASEVGDGIAQVAAAAAQIASSSQSLAQGASQQAASLEETSASSEEITSMTRSNAENSASAAELMRAVDESMREGNHSLDQMLSSMNEIHASSGKISRIIKVIDEIAFQTNILALNAAVEAARAGEAGMGFAVVADEVRNLAQRSAQAAKDTAALIQESIARSDEGGVRLKEVAGVMAAITSSAGKVKTLIDETSAASQEQSRGIGEISRAIQQMSQLTQNTAAAAQEGAASSEELTAQAQTMNRSVARLNLLISGHTEESKFSSARF